eukprot:6490552-Pyramimonas_sp.AAC.1
MVLPLFVEFMRSGLCDSVTRLLKRVALRLPWSVRNGRCFCGVCGWMNLVGDKARSLLGLAPSEAMSLEQ